MQRTASRARLEEDLAAVDALIKQPAATAEELREKLERVYSAMFEVSLDRYDLKEVAGVAPDLMRAIFALRLHLRDKFSLVPQGAPWTFLWVTEFPLFENNDKGQWVSSHHPFTSPKLEHLDILTSDPGKVRAQAYDLVLDGNEIGGGSIRIHRPDVQAKVFEALGLSDEEADAKFGFLLEAFKYGPPPHGGIALGLDRIAMLMTGATSLRDVIAFPKTQRGQDLMTHCPTPADEPQLEELYIRHRPLPSREE